MTLQSRFMGLALIFSGTLTAGGFFACTSSPTAPIPGCSKDTDCASGRICQSGACVGTPVSDTSPTMPVAGDDASATLPPSRPSLASKGEPCKADTDCYNSVCSPVHKLCVECTSASHCRASKPFCVDEQCIECQSTADCHAADLVECNGTECSGCTKDVDCSWKSCTHGYAYCTNDNGSGSHCGCPPF